jgi:hypothetical protein
MTKKRHPRKMLLVATAGLATLTMSACDGITSGNFIASPPRACALGVETIRVSRRA